MTDLPPDELASAYLDDELSTEDRARVERDPALQQRVAELRAVRDAVAAAPIEPASAGARDAAIAAALAAAPVVDLAAERAARARARLRVISVAAAIVVVIGIVGALVRSLQDDSSTKFTAAAGSIPADTAAAAEGAAARATAGDAPTFNARPELGSFTDRRELADAARAAVDFPKSASLADNAGTTTGAAGAPAAAQCALPVPEGSTSLLSAVAVLDGRTVQVDVVQPPDGARQMVVSDPATCAVIFNQPV